MEIPARRTRPITRTVLVLVVLAVAAAWLAPVASAADTHGYPRTYHIFGSGPVDELARYDMVAGWSWFDIAGLRARNPGGLFLLTPALSTTGTKEPVGVTSPGGAIAWTGGTDTLAGGTNLGTIRAVDQNWDLLHNADGSLATVPGYAYIKGWNLADPTAKGTPELVAKLFAYSAKKDGLYANGWDGVHSDNWAFTINESWLYGSSLDTDRDGRVDDPTTLRRNWSNGLALVGDGLRSYLTGKIVGGNGNWYRSDTYAGSDPNGWRKSANYTLVELMEKFSWSTPDTFLAMTRNWLDYPDPLGQTRYMAVLQDAVDANGQPLSISASNPNDPSVMLRPDVMKSMRWGLTLSLMTDVYYEHVFPISNHNTRWWYDEYDGGEGLHKRGYLGQPLGGPVQLASAVYRRDFDKGIAINNSSAGAITVQLGGTFRKLRGTQNPALNDGSAVSSITVPAHDGIILLRDGASTPPAPGPANLAAGRPATASSSEAAAYVPGKAVDGSLSTRWASAERDGEWWQVDLGSAQSVASVSVNWETAYASRYLVQTSLDGQSFSTAADVTATSAGSRTTTFAAHDARYVRIVGVTRGTPWGISFWEAQVFGPAGSTTPPPPPPPPAPEPVPTGNLAAGKAATSSSIEGTAYAAAKAVDGSLSTRWASAERDGEWWQVDLGSAQSVASVSVNWETAYASRYLVQTSLDGQSFSTAADVTATSAGSRTTTFAAHDARYVRIVGVTRGTPWGISFWEAQVYGS